MNFSSLVKSSTDLELKPEKQKEHEFLSTILMTITRTVKPNNKLQKRITKCNRLCLDLCWKYI